MAILIRSPVNMYLRLVRNVYFKSNRCFCTKKEEPSNFSEESSKSKNDVKLHTQDTADFSDNNFSSNIKVKASDATIKVAGSNDVINEASPSSQDKDTTTSSKLLSVLSDLKVKEGPGRSTFNFKLAKPPQRLGKERDQVESVLKKTKRVDYGKEMVSAVKAVASSLGGDEEKIKQELVETLTSIDYQQQTDKTAVKDKQLDITKKPPSVSEDMISAVKAVASSLVGDVEQTESELTKKLLSLATEKTDSTEGSTKSVDMSELFEGIKVDRSKEDKTRRPPSLRHSMKKQITEHQIGQLFSGTPLNIFKVEHKDAQQNLPRLNLWKELQQKELRSLVRFAPSNAYEEMIAWTEQGKLWTFPIDNEAGMKEEENVGFHEHVFLEHLLEGFPKKGPVRLFMELIITGLSKNPYITVERKAEHVAWFREYFEDKEEILRQYEEATG